MDKKNVLENSLWSIAQQFVSIIVSFVMGVYVVRYLGAENSGIINVLNSIVMIIASVSWLGIDSIIINELVKGKFSEETIVWTTMLTKILVTCSILLIFLLVSVLFHFYDINRIIIIVFLGIGVLFQAYETLVYWFQKHLLLKYVSICSIIAMLISLFYQLYLLLHKKSFIYFSIVNAVQNSALFFLLIIVFWRFTRSKPSFSYLALSDMLKQSCHYIVSALAITLYMQIDKVMIGKMLSDYDAGLYGVAVNVAIVWQFVPLSIINSFRPIILKFKNSNNASYIESIKLLNFLITALSLVICISMYLISDYAIAFLYGNEFKHSVLPFKITIWATLISMLGVVRGIWLVAENYNKYDKYFTIIAAVVNVILNYFFIKKWSITGAALATVLSYFLEVFVFNYFFEDTRVYLKIFLSSFASPKRSLNLLNKIAIEKDF